MNRFLRSGCLGLAVFLSSTLPLAAMGPMIHLADVFGHESGNFAVGETVEVTVEAPHLDVSPGADVHSFSASSALTGHAITFNVVESERPGFFRGHFDTGTSAAPTRLWLTTGDTLAVSEFFGDPGAATALVAESRLLFLEYPGGAAGETVLEGAFVLLRLFAPGLDLNASGADTASASVVTLLGQDYENLTLSETGLATGIFETAVSVYRKTASSSSNDLLLSVEVDPVTGAGDVIEAWPGSVSGFGDTIGVGFSRASFVDRAGRPVTAVPRGRELRLRLEAPGFRSSGQNLVQLTVQVSGTEPSGADSETVTLVQTGRESNFFEGLLPVASEVSAASFGNGVFEPGPNAEVRVRHVLTTGFLASEATARVADGTGEFVDAAGEPTDVVVEGGIVRLRLDSPHTNSQPGVRDWVAFVVTNEATGDAEYVQFLETGLDTGVFLGTLPTARTAAVSGNGTLDTTVPAGSPFPPTDRVSANVFYATVSAPVVGARVAFHDRFGRPAARIVAGEAAQLVVERPMANQDPGVVDGFALVVTNETFSGDDVTVNLIETGMNTGIFSGALPSSYRPGTSDVPGRLDLALNDAFAAELVDDLGRVASAQATTAYGRFDWVDADGRPTSDALEGTTVWIEATAPAENDNAGLDFVFGHATSAVTGDYRSFGLTETGNNTGIFRGALGLRTDPVANYDSGSLETWEIAGPPHQWDLVQIGADFLDYSLYFDAEPLIPTGSRTALLDAAGRPVAAIAVGSTVHLRVEDWNVERYASPPGTATTTVRLRAVAGGDEEMVTLTQDGFESAIFRGTVELVSGGSTPAGDGAVAAFPGDQLVAEHDDFVGYSVSSAVAEVAAATVEFLDADGLPTNEVFENGVARLRVTSLASDYGPEPNSLPLLLTSALTGDEVFLTLTETGPSTHVFEGTVALPFGAQIPFDDALQVGGPPDTVTALFADYAAYATATTIGARVRLVDFRGEPRPAFAAGETMTVEVTDPSRNTTSGTDAVTVHLASTLRGTTTPFQLFEVTPGVFRGAVPIHLASHATPDGLTVNRQDTISLVGYTEFHSGLPVTATVGVVDFRTFFLDDAGQPTAEVFESAPVRVRLIAEAADRGANYPDAVEMSVTAEINPDYEHPYVSETGDHTGIFEGYVFTRLTSEAGAFNGQLEVYEQPGPPVRRDFLTISPFLTGPAYPLETGFGTSATTHGSRTAFVATNGDPVDTFTLGADLRVRVWDWNRNVTSDDPGSPADTTTVTITAGSDVETLTVTEIGTLFGGVFEGVLPSRVGAPVAGNGFLEADTNLANLVVTAVHDDFLGYTSSSDEVTAQVGANLPPTANDDSISTNEDEVVFITALANDIDPEGGPLSVTGWTLPTLGSVELLPDGTFQYTPAANVWGSDFFDYEIVDPLGATATARITVEILAVNDPPVTTYENETTTEDSTLVIDVLANDFDVEGEPLTAVVTVAPQHGTAVVQGDGKVLYTPAADFHGEDEFLYTVSDLGGASAPAVAFVTVTPVNDAPTAGADSATTTEDTSAVLAVKANDGDVDGDALTVAITVAPSHGTAAVQGDGTVLYTPAADYSGADAFTYSVSDPSGAAASATVSLTVTPVNDPPVAVADAFSMTMEATLTTGSLANDTDPDGDPLAITALGAASNGTATLLSPDSFSYAPALNFAGVDSFSYTVSDGQGGSAVGTVTITVQRPARIGTNLQVLYNFGEGIGNTVMDMSGVGTPMNLTIGNPANVSWQPGRLAINTATLIQSAGAATKVISAVRASNQVTMEAWVIPRNLTQTGPAAIATISQSTSQRNITLGQTTNRWDTRLRTSTSGAGGVNLTSATGSLTTALTHIVFTRDASGAARVYRDGVLLSSFTTTGNLSTWVTTYKFGIGAELNGGRPWLGDLDLVAVYSRALTATEVRQNFLSGPQ
ncbi:MAG: tandem-95 repeat protein [Thermoanaerobaculia bacterium]|nr:tandem-95 repeat protein [Thermoanaerobaculia bacterium]